MTISDTVFSTQETDGRQDDLFPLGILFFELCGKISHCPLGPKGSIVLKITSSILQMERQRFREEERACSKSHCEIIADPEEGPSGLVF